MANKHSKLNFITGVAAFALVLGAGPAFAQYNSASQTQKSNPGVSGTNEQTVTSANAKTPADDAFAQKAVQADMAEVKLGQLAEQKGTNPAVRDFAKRMVQDHSKNENDLTTTASRENVALPSGIDKADQNTYDRLSKLSGDSFDRAYARDMVKDHTKDVAEFQKEAKDGHDEAIKNYAAANCAYPAEPSRDCSSDGANRNAVREQPRAEQRHHVSQQQHCAGHALTLSLVSFDPCTLVPAFRRRKAGTFFFAPFASNFPSAPALPL